jgi:hypothetical protein
MSKLKEIFDPSDPLSSASVALGPGDRIALECGQKEEWIRFGSEVRRRYAALGIRSYLIAAIGWIFFPLLREAVASLVIRFGVQGMLLSLSYALVGMRIVTGSALMAMWLFPVGGLTMVRTCRSSKRLQSQVGDPYFLTKKSAA